MKAVFLDRDGTIIRERHYLSTPARVMLISGVVEGLLFLKKMGFKLFVITNQSGVGRGYFSLNRLNEINREIYFQLQTYGVFLNGIYSCPHHPKEGCFCRKPMPGLIKKVLREYPEIELNSSYIIGDKERDLKVGSPFGMKRILISKKKAREKEADYTAKDLLDAARFIAREMRVDRLKSLD